MSASEIYCLCRLDQLIRRRVAETTTVMRPSHSADELGSGTVENVIESAFPPEPQEYVTVLFSVIPIAAKVLFAKVIIPVIFSPEV